MKIKPHVHRGRFYNHIHDSMRVRIKSLFDTALYLLKTKFKSKRNKKDFFDPAFKLEHWAIGEKPVLASIDPIITWIGHATFLIQIGGVNILVDPVFSDFSKLFPRMVQPTIDIHDLPKIDFILISHNHPDHMDEKSLLVLKKHNPTVFVPTGDKAWFVKRGFAKVLEKNWWESELCVGQESEHRISFTFLPASHWSGRGLFDMNKSLWGSWLIEYREFKIYFAGDTAYSEHFRAIGRHYPSINVVLMPIGPNEPQHMMKDSHVSTHQALQAFIDLNAEQLIPMHWGTFKSGTDSFDDPIKLLEKLWGNCFTHEHAKMLHVVKFGQAKKFVDCWLGNL